MSASGNRNIHLILRSANLAWALWATLGGVWFITSGRTESRDHIALLFGTWAYAYNVVGYSLLACAAISLLSLPFPQLRKIAAIVCAVWCGSTAVLLQIASPGLLQVNFDAWLLLMCAFTCVCRWALLVLEPYVYR